MSFDFSDFEVPIINDGANPNTIITPEPIDFKTNITPTDHQWCEIKKVVKSIEDGTPVTLFTGYAGTGKTTALIFILNELNILNTTFIMSYTGRSAYVLRRKHLPGNTIHSSIFRFTKVKGKIKYHLRNPDELKGSLIVVDEYSVLDLELLNNLISFGMQILLVGDPMQLPPVGGKAIGNKFKASGHLTKILRLELENPIVNLSFLIRNNKTIKYGKYGDNLVVCKQLPEESILARADQVICYYNNTRRSLNSKIRKIQGYKTVDPQIGEKLVCIQNDRQKMFEDGIFLVNGMTCHLSDIKGADTVVASKYFNDKYKNIKVDVLKCAIKTDFSDSTIDVDIDIDSIYDDKPPSQILSKIQYFLFGSCITAYKSQGGEFDNVIYYSQNVPSGPEFQTRLDYTGVTRASKKLIYIKE